eukprot:421753-Rhodomonas_salina.2
MAVTLQREHRCWRGRCCFATGSRRTTCKWTSLRSATLSKRASRCSTRRSSTCPSSSSIRSSGSDVACLVRVGFDGVPWDVIRVLCAVLDCIRCDSIRLSPLCVDLDALSPCPCPCPCPCPWLRLLFVEPLKSHHMQRTNHITCNARRLGFSFSLSVSLSLSSPCPVLSCLAQNQQCPIVKQCPIIYNNAHSPPALIALLRL